MKDYDTAEQMDGGLGDLIIAHQCAIELAQMTNGTVKQKALAVVAMLAVAFEQLNHAGTKSGLKDRESIMEKQTLSLKG